TRAEAPNGETRGARAGSSVSSRSTPGDEHADGVETVIVGVVQDESRRVRVAEGRASRPGVESQAGAQARAPGAREGDMLDVVARGVRKRRPALQQVRSEALHG